MYHSIGLDDICVNLHISTPSSDAAYFTEAGTSENLESREYEDLIPEVDNELEQDGSI